MSTTVNLKCSCESVKGLLDVVPGSFFHVACLCCDCQRFANHLNSEETILDVHGGTELFQTYPSLMNITEGYDKIACIQLGEKGLYRWHSTCCNMPLGNTMKSAKAPFVGIPAKFMQFTNEEEKTRILGPIIMQTFGKYAIGKMPEDAHPRFPLSFMPKIIWFMLKGAFGRKSAPSPFFKDGNPVSKANVL